MTIKITFIKASKIINEVNYYIFLLIYSNKSLSKNMRAPCKYLLNQSFKDFYLLIKNTY